MARKDYIVGSGNVFEGSYSIAWYASSCCSATM